MAKKKSKKAKKSKPKTTQKSVVLSSVKLAPKQKLELTQTTPDDFVKTRKARGGKKVSYVEGGYVVARLNQALTPAGWEYEVLDEKIYDKEVVVKGRITIHDHVNGFKVSRTQYGTKERHVGKVPLGDTLKAAATDSLKKCASLFGIALDVYWKNLDADDETKSGGKKDNSSKYEKAFQMVASQKNPALLKEWKAKISKSEIYNDEQKEQLLKIIEKQLEEE